MAGITDKEVRSLIARAKRDAVDLSVADGVIPGLNLKASRAGTGSWHFRYYIGDKQKRVVIGQYPAWGISDAREHAKELRRDIDRGKDVAVEKKMARQELARALTIDQLGDDFFARAVKDLAPTTFKQRVSLHKRFVSPLIGNLPAASVTPVMIADVIRRSLASGSSYPRLALVHLARLFAHGVGIGVRAENPCRDLNEKAIVGKSEQSKVRIALNRFELGAFLNALTTIPRQHELAIRLQLLTGVRVGTLTEAKVSEFVLEESVWLIPHSRRKNRRYTDGPFVVPLPPQAVEWVRELILFADKDDFLLPARGRRDSPGRNPRAKSSVINDWLDTMLRESKGAWRRITSHDLRSTCKSWLSELRVDYETRQRYVDHALEGMDAIYDKADYLGKRRAAAELWLNLLNELESGKLDDKVISISSSAA